MTDTILFCLAVTSDVARALDEWRDEHLIADTSEFFYCLGGAFAKLIEHLGQTLAQSSAADSFLEGFSSYRRFMKTAVQDGSISVPAGLDWLIDKNQSVN